MFRKPNGLLLATGGIAVAARVGTLLLGKASWRWNKTTKRIAHDLKQAAHDSGIVRFADFDAMTSLPVPVKRYFHTVLRDGQPIIRIARMRQTGTFSRGGDSWDHFDAT